MGKVRSRRTIVAPSFEGSLTGTAGSVGSGELAETTIQYIAVSLTSAQIKALRAAPQSLVAAPGAGKLIEFVSAQLILDYGTNGLTESTYNLAVRYTNGSGAIVSDAIETTGFIDQTVDAVNNAIAKKDNIIAASACANKALVLHNTGVGEIAGNAANDSVLRVKVAYRVHTTGL